MGNIQICPKDLEFRPNLDLVLKAKEKPEKKPEKKQEVKEDGNTTDNG